MNGMRFWLAATLSILPLTSTLAALTVVDAKASYPEGPLWFQGRLLYVEYGAARVDAWDGAERRTFWADDHCGPSGLIAFRRDHVLVACYDANTLVELGPDGRQIHIYDRDEAGNPFIGPNDFADDGAGGIYFTASGVYEVKAPITGTVLHLSADGAVIRILAGLIHFSNGLTVAKGGRSLLVAEHLAGRILEFPINADGSLGARTVWARLQDLAPRRGPEGPYTGPDGLKLGPDGNYYIAQNGAGRILVVSPDKRLVRTIKLPTPFATNMAFGPEGAATVYLTGGFDQWKPPYPGVVYRWSGPSKAP
jgi:sugar lactone lactonase YvrE